MNETTSKLIEQLAQKFGTTTEYLWSVLIKQAAISASVDIILCILCAVSGVVLYKLHRKFSWSPEGGYSKYKKDDDLSGIMGVVAVIWVVLFLYCLFSITSIVTAFSNPEYWALNKILETLN